MSGFPPPDSNRPNPFGSEGPGAPQGPFGQAPTPNPFAPQSFPPQYPSQFQPQQPGYAPQPTYYPAPPTSKLAIASMVASLSAPVLFCLCLPTVALSLAGVIGGHIALYRISRSKGQMVGTSSAVVALCVGYPLLLISCLLAPGFLTGFYGAWQKDQNADEATRAAQTAFEQAESSILTPVDGTAHGNSPEAIALATEFSTAMKDLRELLFTKRERGFSLSQGKFVTHCELHDGKCCFLVHVPDYRKFDSDAKEALEKLAWMAAQKTVADTLKPGDQLAVGLKGVLLYGSVQIGEVTSEDSEGNGLKTKGDDKELLYPFFPEPEPLTIESEIPLGDQPTPEAPASEAAAPN